jgi:hypothetical protein
MNSEALSIESGVATPPSFRRGLRRLGGLLDGAARRPAEETQPRIALRSSELDRARAEAYEDAAQIAFDYIVANHPQLKALAGSLRADLYGLAALRRAHS